MEEKIKEAVFIVVFFLNLRPREQTRTQSCRRINGERERVWFYSDCGDINLFTHCGHSPLFWRQKQVPVNHCGSAVRLRVKVRPQKANPA